MTDTASRAQWASVAERYGPGWSRATGPDLGWLAEAVAARSADRAIDVGTGAGHAALALAPRVAHVDAVDPTPEMLVLARRLASERGVANIAFSEASAEALPFPDRTFDVAISRFSVHHWPDPAAAFGELARVLRPGGRLGVVDMVAPEVATLDSFVQAVELLRDPTHGRSLRASEWLASLGAAGFDARIARPWEIRHDTEAWLANTNPAPWRADAVRTLLGEAGAAARAAFAIADDGSAFTVGCAVIAATRRA